MKDQRSAGSSTTASAHAPDVLREESRSPHRFLTAALAALALAVVLVAGTRSAGAAPGDPTQTLTVNAFELAPNGGQGAPVDSFTFVVNVDNAGDPNDPDPLKRPGIKAIESHSATVAEGDDSHRTVTVPNPGKYLISIRSPDHKMWGQYVSVAGSDVTANINLAHIPCDPNSNNPDHQCGLPLTKLVVRAFDDNAWTNGAPDFGEGGLEGFKVKLEDQIDGQVIVDYYNNPICTNYQTDANGEIVFDADGAPIVDPNNPGGDCLTGADGEVTIPNLSPATYFVYITPPDGTDWVQTTTIDGGFPLLASQEEGSDGLGAPGEAIFEGPGAATAYWYGFTHASRDWDNPSGTGTIIGTAKNWVEWPPFAHLTPGDPVESPYIALSDSTSDLQVWVGQGDSDGNFTVTGVPAGTYNVAIWDEQLSYIMRFLTVTVADGQTVDLDQLDQDADGQPDGFVGISRWFGWLSGYVYQDTGVAADGTIFPDGNGNGVRDCADMSDWTTCEPGLAGYDLDQRWRDGSIKEDTLASGVGDPHGPGYYEYPTAEGGPLGKFIIGEVGFARFGTEPGASVHDELDPMNQAKVKHICADPPDASPAACDSSEGGGLLTNQLLSEGHRAWVDWGKRPYNDTAATTLDGPIDDTATTIVLASAAGFPSSDGWQLKVEGETMLVTDASAAPSLTVQRGYNGTTAASHAAGAPATYAGEPGQIVGITYFATTRNEFFGNTATNENYEAAIPDVEVRLESTDGTVLNDYITDHWNHPSNGDPQSCDVTDFQGNDISSQLNPLIGPNCLEVPITGEETKDGAFDGGYAFADYCPEAVGGFNYTLFLNSADHVSQCADGSDPVPLSPGTYVTHAVMPTDANDPRPCNPASDGSPGAHLKKVSGPFGNDAGAQTGCLYRIEREEDVNVDLGQQFLPAIPGPPCYGDDHLIDQSTLTERSPYFGNPNAHVPLCDKKVIELKAKQNANADFFLMTNFQNGPDVEEPGRVVGSVFDDIYFERNPNSIWYGEPRPLGHIPIGIYAIDYDYTKPLAQRQKFRLFTTLYTDENGAYEAVLPSLETFNCPIPQGPCPGMYVAIVNDPGTKANPNAGFNPNYLTANTPFDIWPGQTDQLDTPVDPVSGTGCELATGTPELLQVRKVTDTAGNTDRPLSEQGPFLRATDTSSANRRIAIDGVNFGAIGTGGNAGQVTLTDSRTGQSRTFTGLASAASLGNPAIGGIASWADRKIVVQVPTAQANFLAGPKQMMIRTAGGAANGLTTPNGITVHVLGTGYNPAVVKVAPPPLTTTPDHTLQNAINSAPANSLLVLGAGVYQENVILWKGVKLQGIGVGGTIGVAEPGGPPAEDPRFNIMGSVIEGRFFRDNNADGSWNATLAAHPHGGRQDYVSEGADITVVPPDSGANAFGSGLAGSSRIDAIGIQNGQGSFGAGGVQVHAWANNLQLTNDVFESDKGAVGGAVDLGTPDLTAGRTIGDQHNYNVLFRFNRVLGSGGIALGGGLSIFNGTDNYEVANSTLCSNFSNEYGGGISHWGLSPGGTIHDNKIYYNDSFDSGGGITISHNDPLAGQLGQGSGTVNVDRNLIEGNFSSDDGGGIFVQNALTARINIRNNIIVDNGAADRGGAILLDDSSNVAIINNTIADNVSTSSAEGTDGLPHGAGLTAEANDPLFDPANTTADFSNPVALFNNIFWNNQAYTIDFSTTPPSLVTGDLINFEVHGTSGPAPAGSGTACPGAANADGCRRFTPRYSDLSNGNILEPGGTTANPTPYQSVPGPVTPPPALAPNFNITADPLFAAEFQLELAVGPSRLDPQFASVTIVTQDPPVGIQGNYHITAASPAVDRGASYSNFPAARNASSIQAPCGGSLVQLLTGTFFPADYDSQFRPQLRTLRITTPWDQGADELPGAPVPLTTALCTGTTG
jgi:hypothetical protein